MRAIRTPYIACIASPYGYGPASALLSLLRALKLKNHKVVVLASGPAMELLRPEPGLILVSCDIQKKEDLESNRALVQKARALIIIVNRETYRVYSDIRVPKIFIDFLFWMRAGPGHEPHYDADLYLIENFPGTQAAVARHGHLLRNHIVIPPLVQQVKPRSNPNHRKIVVCYGGLESWLFSSDWNSHYATVVTEAISSLQPMLFRNGSLLIACGKKAEKKLHGRFPKLKSSIKQLSHAAFLKELRSASLLLSHPGLYTPFEAFHAKVPVVFLPSANYTDLLQLRHYRSLDIAPRSVDWEDFSGPGKSRLPESLEDAPGISAVLQMINDCARNPAILRSLSERLASAVGDLCDNPDARSRLSTSQHRAALDHGKNGPRIAATIIKNCFSIT